MSQTVRKYLGVGQILASSVFLFNPEVSVVDPLPDVFGWLLLTVGLTCLADLNDSLAGARRLFLLLTWIGGAQTLSLILLFGLPASAGRNTDFLLLPFIFGTLSVVFAIPAFHKLFEGFLYLGIRCDGTAVFRGAEKKKAANPSRQKKVVSAAGRLFVFTGMFLYVKAVFTVLPELSALSDTDYHFGISGVNWFRFVAIFRMASILVMLPIGIVWLCKTISFWKAVKRDAPFIDRLTEKYQTEVLPRESVFVKRTVFRGFVLLGAAALFSVDFYLNRYNVIPDFVAGLFLLAAVLVLRKYLPKYRLLAVGSAVFTLLSAVEWICYTLFVRSSRYGDIYADIRLMVPSAVDAHILTTVFYGVTETLFVVLFLLIVISLLRFVKGYTCFPVNPSLHDSEERLCLEQKPLRIYLYIAVFLSLLAAVCAVFHRVYIPYAMVKRFSFSELLTLISSAVSIGFVSEFCAGLASIRTQVKNKYALD